MKKIVFMSIALLLLVVMQVHALPILQLDADPGDYVYGTEESTVTHADEFVLTALLDPDGQNIASGSSYLDYDFFISIALLPRTGKNDGGNYGSFTFGSELYGVTSDMVWGNPPLADIFANNNDLPSHGVFPTWYKEVSFEWGTSTTIADGYDVQTGEVQTGNLLRYVDFGVNVTQLADGYGLHFDLYGYLRPATGATIDPASLINAPFSHDVTSWPDGGIPPQAIPEPSTIFLLGIGLLVAGGWRRKKKK